jgi:hypothetical protein
MEHQIKRSIGPIELILQMALENPSWGYTRIRGPSAYPTPESNGVSDSAESSVIIIAKQLDELQLRFWTLRPPIRTRDRLIRDNRLFEAILMVDCLIHHKVGDIGT